MSEWDKLSLFVQLIAREPLDDEQQMNERWRNNFPEEFPQETKQQTTLTVEPVREFHWYIYREWDRASIEETNKLSIRAEREKLFSIWNQFVITFVILCHSSRQFDEYILRTTNAMIAEKKSSEISNETSMPVALTSHVWTMGRIWACWRIGWMVSSVCKDNCHSCGIA